jgi:hypothetical protein
MAAATPKHEGRHLLSLIPSPSARAIAENVRGLGRERRHSSTPDIAHAYPHQNRTDADRRSRSVRDHPVVPSTLQRSLRGCNKRRVRSDSESPRVNPSPAANRSHRITLQLRNAGCRIREHQMCHDVSFVTFESAKASTIASIFQGAVEMSCAPETYSQILLHECRRVCAPGLQRAACFTSFRQLATSRLFSSEFPSAFRA